MGRIPVSQAFRNKKKEEGHRSAREGGVGAWGVGGYAPITVGLV